MYTSEETLVFYIYSGMVIDTRFYLMDFTNQTTMVMSIYKAAYHTATHCNTQCNTLQHFHPKKIADHNDHDGVDTC